MKPNSKEEILDISADASSVKILAIETFEELMMARLTMEVLGRIPKNLMMAKWDIVVQVFQPAIIAVQRTGRPDETVSELSHLPKS